MEAYIILLSLVVTYHFNLIVHQFRMHMGSHLQHTLQGEVNALPEYIQVNTFKNYMPNIASYSWPRKEYWAYFSHDLCNTP